MDFSLYYYRELFFIVKIYSINTFSEINVINTFILFLVIDKNKIFLVINICMISYSIYLQTFSVICFKYDTKK